MQFTYIGDGQSITLREVDFPSGVAVAVECPELAEKLSKLPYFSNKSPLYESDDIPENWRDLHWRQRVKIAKRFTDEEITNGGDATAAIELELEARGQH
ncbi:MAG: hypothetical protein AAGF20_00985 [Pseudomonadota bacterium]